MCVCVLGPICQRKAKMFIFKSFIAFEDIIHNNSTNTNINSSIITKPNIQNKKNAYNSFWHNYQHLNAEN